MYMPYLRGRQNELLALRDVTQNGKLTHVLPVIEPVKVSSTLLITLQAIAESNNSVIVITNPSVGDFTKDLKNDHDYKKTLNEYFHKYPEQIIPGRIIDSRPSTLSKDSVSKYALVLSDAGGENYDELVKDKAPRWTLVPDSTALRRRARGSKALLADHFHPAKRNSDYPDKPELFSEDHLFYREEGFRAFADFSIVGDAYNEGGFLPYAIALHIVYLDADSNKLMIKHFKSDSNFDTEDPAGKYDEAVRKLQDWVDDTHPYITNGLQRFLDTASSRSFPGLGSIKRYSIAHHIELMDVYLGNHL